MPVDPNRVKDLFQAALELTAAPARQAFVDRECGADQELRARLVALLSAHEAPATVINQPLVPIVDASPSLAGTLIAGRYKLIEPIGEGGMGSVWLAEQKEPVKRKVAVKLVKPGMDSRAVLARFEAERQALALMDHPHIAKVFDGGMTEQGRPFFVMEFVKGVPLTEYCDNARLSVRQRLELFISICQAVQHAHQKGIIHRDLKPSNLLICLYDGKPVPKVIDFGLAKAMHQSLTEQTLHTALGTMVGTPLYVSPEQAELNNLDVDTRTDIYSLGVILYELLTGTTPLEKQRLKMAAYNEVLRLIREVEPPKPSTRLSGSASLPSVAVQRSIEPKQLAKALTGELDWIVMKALDKERSRRYETATGLARDVERYLHDEAVEASPPSASYRLRKLIRKHRTALGTATAFVALLVLGTTISVWQAIRATQAEGVARAALEAEAEQRQLAQESAAEATAAGRAAEEARQEAEERRLSAEQERSRAEQREQLAIDAVQRFGDAVAGNPELMNSPQLASLRKTLLQEPLGFFRTLRERLQADHDSRPETLVRLAKVAFSLGKLTNEIGDKQDALRIYQESLAISERLAQDHPAVPAYRIDLASSYNNIGNLLGDMGKFDDALAIHEQSRQLKVRLRQECPDITGIQSDLASTYNNIGNIFNRIDNTDAALVNYKESLGIWSLLAKANPQNTKFQSNLAGIYNNIAVLYEQIGKKTEAVNAFTSAIEILRRLTKGDPANPEFQSKLAGILCNQGNLLRAIGRPSDAISDYQQGLTIQERLVREFPSSTGFCRDLANNYTAIGNVLSDAGNSLDAIAAYENALKIHRQLVSDHPTVIELQSELAMTLSNFGVELRRIGKTVAALTVHEESRIIREKLVIEHPSVTEFQHNLGASLNNLALLDLDAKKVCLGTRSPDLEY